jgi:ribosomal protein S27E
MTNVVDLKKAKEKKKQEYCFTCGCGNQTFVLRPDARVECSVCGNISDHLLWGQYFVSPSGGIDSGPIT